MTARAFLNESCLGFRPLLARSFGTGLSGKSKVALKSFSGAVTAWISGAVTAWISGAVTGGVFRRDFEGTMSNSVRSIVSDF